MAKKQTAKPAGVDFSSMAGAGMENVGMDELAVPFLCIVQSNSPQLSRKNAKFIAGAEQGDLFNNVTSEVVYNQGGMPLPFVPCSRQKLYVEWRPRSTGGGLAGMHEDPSIMNQTKRVENSEGKSVDQLPNGNQIIPTLYFQGKALIEGTWQIMVIALAMTQMKKGRQWMTQLANTYLGDGKERFAAPMFSHRWEIGTEPETRNNNDFWGWAISRGGQVADAELAQACFELSKTGSQKLLSASNAPALSDGDEDDVLN